MADNLASKLLAIVPFKKKARAGGTANTPTYNPQNADQVLTLPQYRDHQDDLFQDRLADNSQSLIKKMMQNDPDMSGTVNGYLTLADTQMIVYAEDLDGNVDEEKSRELQQLVTKLSHQTDYTLGFQLRQGIYRQAEELRYMLLMRGAIGGELVFDKAGTPDHIRNVDMAGIRWVEKKPGDYKPGQVVPGVSDPVPIDTPAFMVAFYRRDPTAIYTVSPFVSAINTIAARQQVINDLYRIMRATGYPRIEIKVLEEILTKNMPATYRQPGREQEKQDWLNARYGEIQSAFDNIAVDQSLVHSDAVELKMLNDKAPGTALNITPIIEVLNAQNQAALKTMSTILGRGSSGVNTGSVEARLAALYADQLNEPLADFYGRMFSFVLHQDGYQGFARVEFDPAELRPWTELEPQLTLRSQRLRQDLSDGLITDVEYHLWVYKRLPPPGAPQLSGTGFLSAIESAPAGDTSGTTKAKPEDVSPKTDSVGRASSPPRTRATAANRRQTRRLAMASLTGQAYKMIEEQRTDP
ncbi:MULTISPECIES: hypothetical protein [Methylobacterium]|uniref:Portal protein n=6 Tax=Pseudomonadota TaxID=1224 RepID=A0ABQ4SYL4_9HYPH|nr:MULTISPECIES: hypothetical protein [Methylobacterium]PIU05660.1 MAG: hypothetical protein COT56_13530 [Methylobacterium sp. CG09_land_8_20_14_0_10_71_15]PIU12370.1 MAG: hypothetical protein COT28_15375 [Methylobacterium sp. CG08_land_8_20_14_0_20_71_15]GBU16882.1 hypothetical protein AwMethylo_10970 [Methylobacterium sp.]GJE07972.1 hypothetical protein AOPFMNJM_3304 [Methylobacterium jeotgali]